MKLTKQDALDLTKVLFHYETLTGVVLPFDLGGLQEELESFLLEGTEDEQDEDLEEEGEIDSEGEDSSRDEEVDEEEDVQSDPDADDDEEGGEDPEHDAECTAGELTSLKSLSGRIVSSGVGEPDDKVKLSFDETDLVVDWDGSLSYIPVSFMKRLASELQVGERVEQEIVWHRFSIPKFGKKWVEQIGPGLLYKVVDEDNDWDDQ